MPKRNLTGESWEQFDAEALFPPPTIHTNKIIKVDKKQMQKVDQDEFSDITVASFNPDDEPEDGDMYTDALPDKGHVDQMFEMEGLEGGKADDREVKADKEEDRRTQEPESSEQDEPETPKTDDSKAQAKEKKDKGAEKPIQKEKEGVDEVAEATSKTSEDVHGGDEATKDIEDSPNAADDGQNPDNQGAEAGEGGTEGDGTEGEGQQPSGTGIGTDQPQEQQDAEAQAKADVAAQEEWEKKADQSAIAQSFEDSLEKFEAKVRQEKGHRTSLPSYQFDREESPVELEVAFKKAGELVKKLAAEEDLTARVAGRSRWDAKALTHAVVSYRHPRVPSSRYDRPKEADIVILLDISGSCAAQAEMFMAIASGAVGNGVRIFVGYNGSARASAMTPPKRRIRSYAKAKAWVQSEVNRVSGWHNAAIGEWSFRQLVEEVKPKTLIIFGDWDGIDQYTPVARDPKFHSTKFFWFANEGNGSWRVENAGSEVPQGWTRKSYFSGIYRPQDLVKALRRIR